MNIDHPIMDSNEISRGGIVEDVPFLLTSLALAQRLKRLEKQKPTLHASYIRRYHPHQVITTPT